LQLCVREWNHPRSDSGDSRGSTAGTFLYWLQSRIRLTRAIRDWIGVPVSWSEMPRMRAEAFDRWKQMKEAGIKPRPGIHRY
jgi:hypothetical protein